MKTVRPTLKAILLALLFGACDEPALLRIVFTPVQCPAAGTELVIDGEVVLEPPGATLVGNRVQERERSWTLRLDAGEVDYADGTCFETLVVE